ncbi:unnamed protein product [Protopolystoma xenopodis]|uniref:Uncharacterized protein n=1 Tax=Protopolystoma xenopodis TaxID=117903 RepID=A0A448WTK0_9PLAT|nr:unnamed protein product [Protopolystoma xenopodis]
MLFCRTQFQLRQPGLICLTTSGNDAASVVVCAESTPKIQSPARLSPTQLVSHPVAQATLNCHHPPNTSMGSPLEPLDTASTCPPALAAGGVSILGRAKQACFQAKQRRDHAGPLSVGDARRTEVRGSLDNRSWGDGRGSTQRVSYQLRPSESKDLVAKPTGKTGGNGHATAGIVDRRVSTLRESPYRETSYLFKQSFKRPVEQIHFTT